MAVVDWELGASYSQEIVSSSKRKKKRFLFKELFVCNKGIGFYGIPAINTWPVGRHLALLNKIIKDKIHNDEG